MNRRNFIQRMALGICSLPFINKIPRLEHLPPTPDLPSSSSSIASNSSASNGRYTAIAGADIRVGDLLIYKDYGKNLVVPMDSNEEHLMIGNAKLITLAGIAGNNARAYVDKVKILAKLDIK